jgi:release factor glutamine methyltransferase
METWTIAKLLDWTTAYFKTYKIETPHLEAEILLAHALKLKRIELYTGHERILNQNELNHFKTLIQRRSKHEPLAYITGFQPFMSLDIFVDRSVLIPRPETEKLVEVAIDLVKRQTESTTPYSVADIGTGSGAIAISLAKYLPDILVIGIDSSSDALKIAHKNANLHNVENRCQFSQGNLLEPLSEKVDMIISNPPYIPSEVIATLQPEVKDWEPHSALDGGKDGLNFINQLLEKSPLHLKAQAFIIMEIGFDQAEKVKEKALNHFQTIKIIKDYSGKDRIFLGQIA